LCDPTTCTFVLIVRRAPPSTPFPYTMLFRSRLCETPAGPIPFAVVPSSANVYAGHEPHAPASSLECRRNGPAHERRVSTPGHFPDRKSTRLNSSHVKISYAVFCLKKKKKNK